MLSMWTIEFLRIGVNRVNLFTAHCAQLQLTTFQGLNSVYITYLSQHVVDLNVRWNMLSGRIFLPILRKVGHLSKLAFEYGTVEMH